MQCCPPRTIQRRVPPFTQKSSQASDRSSIPSWRRICRTIIKNDYWCRSLSFSPNKTRTYERYKKRIREQRKQWGIL
ncbi:DUF3440 domain-containing protein [Citrobacter amalonaticus]|nr:DUF3440 domain-containing protein [Citrobacter amalonaticus]